MKNNPPHYSCILESDVLSLVDESINALDLKEQKQALEVISQLNQIFDILKKKEFLRDTLRVM